MSRAIIIANGHECDYSYYKSVLKADDYIICADGAVKHCINMRIVPDLWIGDFDSCNYDSIVSDYPDFEHVEMMKLNPVKDETDTHKCCMVAIEKGFSEICIWCATGNRADHMIANIHLLEFLKNNHVKGIIEDSKNIITLCYNEMKIIKQRKYLSLIPLDESVTVEKTDGLLYSLENYSLSRCISMGVSNEFCNNEAWLKIKDGLMLVIQSDD